MNAQATAVPTRTTASRRLYEMLPGYLFRALVLDPEQEAPDGSFSVVLALLHRHHTAVSDERRIWCVVIYAAYGTGFKVGELLALPRETPVQRLHAPDVLPPLAREH